MLNTDEIFKGIAPDEKKLVSYGFAQNGGVWEYSLPIMNGQFNVKLTVCNDLVDYFVYDAESGDRYDLVKIEGASGSFLGEMRSEIEKILYDIKDKCCAISIFKFAQTMNIVSYIKQKYSVTPEFLWGDHTGSAALRHPDTLKWFGIIMTVDKSKVISDESGTVEIMDMKASPERLNELVEQNGYYRGYHMNKKHWYTVILDGTLDDGEIFERIDESFEITK